MIPAEQRAPHAPRERPRSRPFLKWAGGKSRLLPELKERLPASFGTYHEPFLGGGAVFFELSGGRIRRASLSDVNAVLIDTYRAVRDGVEGVIRSLGRYTTKNDPESYYQVRDRDERRLTPAGRAARVIYLNKTCFNGLYRENRRGRFNVPFGRYKNPPIRDTVNLRAASRALQGVELAARPFGAVLDLAEPGDLVYLDPPYHPVSETASFTSYHQDGFRPEDQESLRDVFAALVRRRVHVLLSNSDTPLVRSLYRDFRIDRVWAPRAINSRGDRRGKVAEVIVVGS